jgi:hypothetical protein
MNKNWIERFIFLAKFKGKKCSKGRSGMEGSEASQHAGHAMRHPVVLTLKGGLYQIIPIHYFILCKSPPSLIIITYLLSLYHFMWLS